MLCFIAGLIISIFRMVKAKDRKALFLKNVMSITTFTYINVGIILFGIIISYACHSDMLYAWLLLFSLNIIGLILPAPKKKD